MNSTEHTHCLGVKRLWDALESLLGNKIDEYSDDEWCEDFPADKYFVFVLTWGPLRGLPEPLCGTA
jgi:hypothetical protein